MTTRKIEWVRRAKEEAPGGGVERRRTILEPDPAAHDPILLWGEDWFRKGAFEAHAHRGFATMTYLAEGHLTHGTSLGHRGTLGPGDALFTVAGSGIMHDAQPIGDTVVHGMQLWLNLPAAQRMTDPCDVALSGDKAPAIGDAGFRGRVFAGRCNGVRGPAPAVTPFTFIELRFDSGGLDLAFAADQAGVLYVLDGEVDAAGDRVREGEGARFRSGPGTLPLKAEGPGLALLAAGRPLRAPTLMDGPFVLSTKEQVAQAYADLEAGAFGVITR